MRHKPDVHVKHTTLADPPPNKTRSLPLLLRWQGLRQPRTSFARQFYRTAIGPWSARFPSIFPNAREEPTTTTSLHVLQAEIPVSRGTEVPEFLSARISTSSAIPTYKAIS